MMTGRSASMVGRGGRLGITVASGVLAPTPCAMVVYLRTGPDEYQAYSLEGGP
jgi:hypothetical protein